MQINPIDGTLIGLATRFRLYPGVTAMGGYAIPREL